MHHIVFPIVFIGLPNKLGCCDPHNVFLEHVAHGSVELTGVRFVVPPFLCPVFEAIRQSMVFHQFLN